MKIYLKIVELVDYQLSKCWTVYDIRNLYGFHFAFLLTSDVNEGKKIMSLGLPPREQLPFV